LKCPQTLFAQFAMNNNKIYINIIGTYVNIFQEKDI
jgi:hypothetical protein